MTTMPPDQRIMPKADVDTVRARQPSRSDLSDQGDPEPARSRKRMTAIACYQCRKRKCKCDGKNPCGNCVRRNTACAFDTVSGSVHTEDLKERIRKLEGNLHALQERNRTLEDALQRHGLASAVQPSAGTSSMDDEEVWTPSAIGPSTITHAYSPRSSHHTSSPSEGQPPQHYATNMRPRGVSGDVQRLHNPQARSSFALPPYQPQSPEFLGPEQRSSTANVPNYPHSNEQLEYFLAEHRMALEKGQDPNIILNSGLDVGPLIDPARPMTEWSSWALQLPLAVPDMTFCSKLACAYVTYHQLRWLIYPTEENYNMIPSFIKPMVAQLCIPHTVWVHLLATEGLHASKVLITDVPQGLPNLLSRRLRQWSRPMTEATMFHLRSGHTRLTPDFVDYIKEASSWVDANSNAPPAGTGFTNFARGSAPFP